MKELIEKLENRKSEAIENRDGGIQISLTDLDAILPALQASEWIGVGDLKELPQEEVLAISKTKDCLVGRLKNQLGYVDCEDDHQLLLNVTHFKYLTPPNK